MLGWQVCGIVLVPSKGLGRHFLKSLSVVHWSPQWGGVIVFCNPVVSLRLSLFAIGLWISCLLVLPFPLGKTRASSEGFGLWGPFSPDWINSAEVFFFFPLRQPVCISQDYLDLDHWVTFSPLIRAMKMFLLNLYWRKLVVTLELNPTKVQGLSEKLVPLVWPLILHASIRGPTSL